MTSTCTLAASLVLLVGCASAPVAPPAPVVAPLPCDTVGERAAFNDDALLDLYVTRKVQPVVAGDLVLLCGCGARALGGDVEARTLGGDVEARALGGDVEARTLGGDVEARSLGGDVEARRLGGDVEARALGGDVEARALGGDVEDRKLGGDVEARTLGGDVEARRLGGDVQMLTCQRVAGCGGYTVSGRGPLQFFDGVSLKDAPGRCVE